jgi:PAS domain S-box-containing protein
MKDEDKQEARVVEVPALGTARVFSALNWSVADQEQLLQREQEARLEAEVMRDANLALTEELSLETVLEALLTCLRQILPYDTANVMLCNDALQFEVAATRGYEGFLVDPQAAKADSLDANSNEIFRTICSTRRSLLVVDTDKEPAWQRLAGGKHVRCWIGVPLIAHDKVIGLYSLDKTQPGFFTNEHVRRAELLAAQAATAIQNAQLFRRIENYAAELEERMAEQKSAEAAKALSEELFREAFDNAPLGMVLNTADGRRLKVNRAFCRMVGYSEQELLGMRLASVLHPDDRGSLGQGMLRLVTGDIDRDFKQWRYIHADGHVVYADVSASIVRDEQGRPEYIVALLEDTTESKRAEERLQEYEKVIEGLEEMIVVVDREYRYLIANRAFLNYRDLKRDQVIGHLVSDSLDHATFEIVRQKLDECFQGRVVRYELRNPYPNLGERDLFLSYFPIEGPGGVDRAACIFRDITEQKRAEKALRKAEKKYRDIFENAGEGIFQTTPEGQYIDANPALASMHGLDSPESLIRNFKDISHEVYVDPARREEFKDLIEAQGFVRGFEHQIFRRDGSKIWISVNARAVRDEQGKTLYYEGTIQDINERKLAEVRSAAFATLARKLSGATTPLEAGRIIAETASELFGWDACNFDLYDANNDLVHPILNVDTIAGRRVDTTASCIDRKPTARARRVMDHRSELLLREDPIRFDQDAVPFGDTTRPSASIMTVSVRHASRVVGMLSIQSYTPRAYDDAALSDLQSLAEHCGEALNRIHAEQSFYESEERFRQTAEHFEDVVWLTDKNISEILYINPAYERTFRRTCESVYERLESFLDAVHPEDRAGVERMIENQRKGNHAPLEYRILWPDGSVRWMLGRSFPMRNTEGEINLVAGIAQDITERKRADESLKVFRNLIDQSSDAIEVIDPVTLRFVDCNETAYRCLGYSREEFLSLTVFDIDPLVTPSSIARLDEEMKESGSATLESVHRRKDGTTFPVEVNVKLIELEKVYRLAVVRDITARKRAQEALRESEARYRDLVENSREFICTHDLDGLILSANRAAVEMLGYDPDDYCGKKNFREILAPEVRPQFDDYLTLIRRDGIASGLCLVQTSSGERRIWEYYNTLRTEGVANPTVRGMARDITERRQAEEALKISERKYRDIVSFAPVGIYQSLHNGTLITANQTLAKMLGYDSVEELLKLNLDNDIYLTAGELQNLITEYENKGKAIDLEVQWKRRDGSTFWVQLNWHVVKRADGGTEYFEGFVRDITDERRAKEALRASEERYRELFDNAKDAIYVHDLSGRYVS